jgi:hypothetical protein
MARSTYIYIAYNHADELLGAWTVKHELLNYRDRVLEQKDKDYHIAKVIRTRDGQGVLPSHPDWYPGPDITDITTDIFSAT